MLLKVKMEKIELGPIEYTPQSCEVIVLSLEELKELYGENSST